MMYPYMTLNDNTEITHSEMQQGGRVKVYIETQEQYFSYGIADFWHIPFGIAYIRFHVL